MNFIFKKKKIVLHAILHEKDANLLNIAPIVEASAQIPEWWKKVPNGKINFSLETPVVRTVKSCIGIKNSFTNGFLLPMWSDLALDINPGVNKFNTFFSDSHSQAQIHPNDQIPGFYSDHTIVKINTPWKFHCDYDINFLCLDPIYFKTTPKPFITFSGIVDYKYQKSTNVLIGFNNFKETRYVIKVGDPLMHIVPLTESEIELKLEVLENLEYSKIDVPTGNFFTNGYHRLKKITEDREKKEKSKCPFGFGKK